MALGGKVDKVSMIDAATGLAAVDLKRRGGAAKPSVVSAETRAAEVAEHEAALAALAEEREAAEKKREEAREKREVALAEQLEAMRAKRALQLETYATMDAEREAMMTTALPEKVAAEPIDDPKVTEKPSDTGAGKKTDEHAAEKVSAGAPAEEDAGEDRTPPPEPTEDRADRPKRKGKTSDTGGATEVEE